MSTACSGFGYRQVSYEQFFFKIALDSFVFVLRKIEKGFITNIHFDI